MGSGWAIQEKKKGDNYCQRHLTILEITSRL
jgi:hypothetical protein